MNTSKLALIKGISLFLVTIQANAQNFGYMGKKHLISYTINPMSLVFEPESTVPEMGIQYEYGFKKSSSIGLKFTQLNSPSSSNNNYDYDILELSSSHFEFSIGKYNHAFGVGSYVKFVTGVIASTGLVKGTHPSIELPYEKASVMNIPVGLDLGFSRIIRDRFRIGGGFSLSYAIPTAFNSEFVRAISTEEIRDTYEAHLAENVMFNNIFAISINVGILL